MCSTLFADHTSLLLHVASTYSFKDMTKDLEVPFVSSETDEI